MDYGTGRTMRVGDVVLADGMDGIIVCDFDRREFVRGYEDWDMPQTEMIGGGTLSSGVMVRIEVAGLVHHEEPDTIEFVRRPEA